MIMEQENQQDIRSKVSKYLKTLGRFLGISVTFLFLIFIGPFLMVWGLNLMGLDVPYSLKSFFGAFLLILSVGITNRLDSPKNELEQ